MGTAIASWGSAVVVRGSGAGLAGGGGGGGGGGKGKAAPCMCSPCLSLKVHAEASRDMTALLEALHSLQNGLGYIPQLPSHTAGRERSVGTEKEPLPAKETLDSNVTAPYAPLERCRICRP